ncbi:MAG: LysR family transcriptional regulator [Colwellia sp.]
MNIDDLNLCLRVAAIGNMSEVARQLNVTPQAASAAISRVEKKLNARLFERSTRAIRLSIEGEAFIPLAEKIIDTWGETQQKFLDVEQALEGIVHVGVASDFSRHFLLDVIDDFQIKHPKLTIQLHVSDSMQSFLQETLDIVIRYGELQDSSLIARKLLSVERVLCASPEYLKLNPPISCLKDLTAHNCITFNRLDTLYSVWRLYKEGIPEDVKIKGALSANDGDIVRLWGIRGRGVIYKSAFDCAKDITSGKLQIILPEYSGQDTSIYAVYPSRKFSPTRVVTFIDFLQDKLKNVQLN